MGLPHIRFHDLRHTYATLLMKNDINQKAVAAALGHSKSIITVDTYTDIQAIIADCVQEIQSFIEEVHPYVILCQEKVQIKNDFFPSCQHT